MDWESKIDPLRCISMHEITKPNPFGQKDDATIFVNFQLGDLESRVSLQFVCFVDEAFHQIERNDSNVKKIGLHCKVTEFQDLNEWPVLKALPSYGRGRDAAAVRILSWKNCTLIKLQL
ncbi:exocyst complex component SEC3A isoform X2 [Rosa chinensis]|nr:exocyst complex component SEC3A isoform X2 [Rosa chinensis]